MDSLSSVYRDLAAISAIDLITVICRRIVRSSDVDAGKATKFSYGEAQRRGRLDTIKQIGLDSVASEHLCSLTDKFFAPVAGITTEHNRWPIAAAV